MELSDNTTEDILSELYDNLSRGLLYTHNRLNANTTKTLEAASFLYGLIELLDEKGILTIEELDERKKQVAERLVRKFSESGMGLMYQDPEYDKYTFEHGADEDCQNRLPVCKAVCCKFPFALSRQDVEEGIIHWEFGRPYLIAHGADGYCVHLDRENYKCTVYEHRTVPCRGFNCKDNERWKVWADYEKKVIDPDLTKNIEKDNGKIYSIEPK